MNRCPRALIATALALAVLTSACSGQARSGVDDGSRSSAAASEAELASQVDAFYERSLSLGLRDRRALVVAQGDRVLYERYFDGSDSSTTAEVFSVTKSIMATLVGVAVEQGLLALDDPLAELLPQYAPVMSEHAAAVTLRQVLTMTAGFPEDDAAGPTGTAGPDGVATLLSAPPAVPGAEFAYSSSGSHILSAILMRATGRPVLEYARQVLFDPLGISTRPAFEPVVDLSQTPSDEQLQEYEAASFAWPLDAQGRHLGFGTVKLTARDMLALGRLYLDQGRWDDVQVVSSSWVAEATRSHVQTGTPQREGYGYQWWTTEADGYAAFAAIGYGGQHIEVVPDLDLVVVASTTVGEANPVDPSMYLTLVDQVVAPAVRPPA